MMPGTWSLRHSQLCTWYNAVHYLVYRTMVKIAWYCVSFTLSRSNNLEALSRSNNLEALRDLQTRCMFSICREKNAADY